MTIAQLDPAGSIESAGIVTARAVVLATGGYGQVFASTSNPPAVTGDGVAIALRAGLAVRDVEFVQFHPTVLYGGPDATGQQALVSEAVRGEGAILYDGAGERVMVGVHPQEDLAPRDVVAAAISRRMAEAPGGIDDHVFLDATHLGERFATRFPSITAACRRIGIDPARDRIPVAPAAHYACGGVPAGLDGTTALAGLYAVGEVSCTGVHGANRLASNSLTESVVSGTRLGRDLAWELLDAVEPDVSDAPGVVVDAAHRPEIRAAMSRYVGVVRDAESLDTAAAIARRRGPQDRRGDTAVTGFLGGDEHADRRDGGRRRCGSAPREPRLPPTLRLPGAARRVAAAPRRPARDRRRGRGRDGLMFQFHPLADDTRRRLLDGGLDPDAVAAIVRMAVAEDLMGGVDVTSLATVPADQRSVGTFASRGHGVVAGLAVAAAAIDAVCGGAVSDVEYLVGDGDRVAPGDEVARVTAPTRALLTAERTALNLLCHLSGVATLTRRWADALEGTRCVVRDTRKTMPGLRALEKYAVRQGGGHNHRMGLSDAALVKDNHVLAAGGVAAAFAAVRSLVDSIPVEIEVDSLDGLRVAIDAGADAVLLDNFDLAAMRAAVGHPRRVGATRRAGGERRADAGGRPSGRGDRRRPCGRRRADALGAGARHRSRPASGRRRSGADALLELWAGVVANGYLGAQVLEIENLRAQNAV